MFHISFLSLLFALVFSAGAHAYTWKFENNPRQCQSLRVKIEGDDGQAPYRITLIPYGASPGQFETRYVQTITFNSTDDGGKSLDFQLNYPTNSQFVAVVGDRNGFATGGTSMPWTVRESSDNACFDGSKTRRPKWPYFYLSTEGIRSCETTRVFWNATNPNITGQVHFAGIYPGGQSWNISAAPLEERIDGGSSNTTGFNWTVPINPGADILLLSGDEGGSGPAGQVKYTVSPPQDPANINCSPNMPSMTPSPPAGGDPSQNLDSQPVPAGAIAGGVVGGIAVLVGIAVGIWFFRRRTSKGRHGQYGPPPEIDNGLSFIPQPYPMAEHVTPYSAGPGTPHSPYSAASNHSGFPQQPAPGPRKSHHSPSVEYFRHQDAGDLHTSPQRVDLPPEYNPSRSVPPPSVDSSSQQGGNSAYAASLATATSLRPSYYSDQKGRPPSSGGGGPAPGPSS